MDLFTTFSYLADVEVPNDRIIDGNNLSNVFKSLSIRSIAVNIISLLNPTIITAASSIASGLSKDSLIFKAGKFSIEDSSLLCFVDTSIKTLQIVQS